MNENNFSKATNNKDSCLKESPHLSEQSQIIKIEKDKKEIIKLLETELEKGCQPSKGWQP